MKGDLCGIILHEGQPGPGEAGRAGLLCLGVCSAGTPVTLNPSREKQEAVWVFISPSSATIWSCEAAKSCRISHRLGPNNHKTVRVHYYQNISSVCVSAAVTYSKFTHRYFKSIGWFAVFFCCVYFCFWLQLLVPLLIHSQILLPLVLVLLILQVLLSNLTVFESGWQSISCLANRNREQPDNTAVD